MKVENETPEELVLKDSAITGIVGGAVLILIGIYVSISVELDMGRIFISALLVVMGIVAIAMSPLERRITINKTNITVASKKIHSAEKEEYKTADVSEVEIKEDYSITTTKKTKGKRRDEIIRRLSIIVKGKKITLMTIRKKGGVISLGEDRISRLGKKVADFIGVPLNEKKAPLRVRF